MRDVELARRYKRELRRRGVRVVAVQQEVGDDPNGELMEGIYEIFDQHESRIIGARVRAAMKYNARQGYANGALPPFGFRFESCTGPGGRLKRRSSKTRARRRWFARFSRCTSEARERSPSRESSTSAAYATAVAHAGASH